MGSKSLHNLKLCSFLVQILVFDITPRGNINSKEDERRKRRGIEKAIRKRREAETPAIEIAVREIRNKRIRKIVLRKIV